MIVGAGTVLDVETAQRAFDASDSAFHAMITSVGVSYREDHDVSFDSELHDFPNKSRTSQEFRFCYGIATLAWRAPRMRRRQTTPGNAPGASISIIGFPISATGSRFMPMLFPPTILLP
jgi:hypothetical protein